MCIMSKVFLLLAICLTSTVALSEFYQENIIEDAEPTSSQHPYAAIILYGNVSTTIYLPVCIGAIINNRSILTALSCWNAPNNQINLFRVRVGSDSASAGGSLHKIIRLISHSNYVLWNQANNIGIMRVDSDINFGTNVRPIPIATTNSNLADYQFVLAIKLIRTHAGTSEQLSAVELRTINQGRCETIYGLNFVSASMLCAGWETGGRRSCRGDIGAPLIHNNAVVGVTAYTYGCGDGNYPSIYSRVSRYASWIISNA